MRKLLLILPVVLCLLAVAATWKFSESHMDSDFRKQSPGETSSQTVAEMVTTTPYVEEPTTESPFTIQLHFVGDCLCATDARTHYENCFNDVADVQSPKYFLSQVSKMFLNDDFTIADCENVYSDDDTLPLRDKGQYADPSIEAYWFKSKSKNAKILSVGGIDLVSVDNNHINDYGPKGRTDTLKALDKVGVLWGEEGKIVYYKKNGFKIGVICVSMYSGGVVPTIKKYIKKAAKKSDYQIVYFHGGTEAIHVPESWKVSACHQMIDAGADMVIGDHPHVLQPLEIYKKKTIIYSMGNFIFGGNRHPENRTIIYRHTLHINSQKELESESGKIIPCYVYTGDTNNWQPAIIEDKSIKKKVIDFMNGKTDSPI